MCSKKDISPQYDYYSKKKLFLDHVEKIIKLGIVDTKDKKGNSLLHVSVKNDYIDIVYILLYEGVPVNILDDEGNTALHFVKSKDCAELLLRNGANPNIQNNKGDTPLHTIVKNLNASNDETKYLKIIKYKEIITLLLEYGADIYIKNNLGKTYDKMTNNLEFSSILVKNHNNFILFDIKI